MIGWRIQGLGRRGRLDGREVRLARGSGSKRGGQHHCGLRTALPSLSNVYRFIEDSENCEVGTYEGCSKKFQFARGGRRHGQGSALW